MSLEPTAAMTTARVLAEALPYIQRFQGKSYRAHRAEQKAGGGRPTNHGKASKRKS